MKAKILWWKSPDGSQVEIVRAYDEYIERAEQDFQLVKEDKSRLWSLTEIDFIKQEVPPPGLDPTKNQDDDLPPDSALEQLF